MADGQATSSRPEATPRMAGSWRLMAGRCVPRCWGGTGVDLLVALGLVCASGAMLMQWCGQLPGQVATVKLESDVAVLNEAVRAYEMMGGNMLNVAGAEEALTRLKAGMPEETRRKLLGVRGSMLDPRMRAVMQTPEEARMPGLRAVWDGGGRSFIVWREGGAGVKKFENSMPPAALESAVQVADNISDRKRWLDAGTTSGWVWDYSPAQPSVRGPGTVVAELAGDSQPVEPPDGEAPVGPGSVSGAKAWGEFLTVNLSVAGIPVTLGPVGRTEREGSQPFTVSHDFDGHVGVPLLGLVRVIQVEGSSQSAVASDVNGGPGSRYATGVGEAASFSLKLIELPKILILDPPPVLEIRAQVLRSSATVSGTWGSLQAAGTSTITGLQVRVMGGDLVRLEVSGEDNQVIGLDACGLAGVKLIVSEASSAGGAESERTTWRCALRVKIEALPVAGLGLVTGDVQVAQAGATLKALPALD